MDKTPSLEFHAIRNGDNDTFPSYACGICFLDGHPELLHIRKIIRTEEQTELLRVGTYRSGNECTIFETDAPKDKRCRMQYNGNAISITHRNSNIGTAIIYENGSFRAEMVTAPREGILNLIRADGSDYFHYDKEIISSNSRSLQLKALPRNQTYFIQIAGKYIVKCYLFDDSTTIVAYELANGAYREKGEASVPFKTVVVPTLGNNYIVLLGASELAVIDCTRMEPTRFAFSQVPGDLIRIASRFVGNGTMEIYFSTIHEDRCRIYKASLSLQVRKARFETKRIKKGIFNFFNRPRTTETSRQQKGHAAHDREIAEAKEQVAKLESTVVEEKKENANMKEKMATLESTVAKLQASLETLEKKYTNVLLALAKK